MRGNGLRLHQRTFTLDFGKNFMVRAVKHWNRLSREVVELPSLEVSKKCVGMALKDMVKQQDSVGQDDGWAWWCSRSFLDDSTNSINILCLQRTKCCIPGQTEHTISLPLHSKHFFLQFSRHMKTYTIHNLAHNLHHPFSTSVFPFSPVSSSSVQLNTWYPVRRAVSLLIKKRWVGNSAT